MACAPNGGPCPATPYLTPDWAKLIGDVRDDARVCVIQDGAGFFGAQRLSRFAAMGLGAPISDYQGVVGLADLPVNGADILPRSRSDASTSRMRRLVKRC